MKERRAEIQYSPCSEKFYVQIFGPSGRKSGDPIDVTNQLLGWWLQELVKRPNGLRITQTIPISADYSVCVGPDGSQEVKLRGTVTKVYTAKIVSVELRPSDEATPTTPNQEPQP